MSEEHPRAASSRFLKLAEQFHDKEFRDAYVSAHTRRFLARQMRKFRGNLSQTAFAEQLGKRQTIVSRLENPDYSGWTLGTLLEIANKLNVGVVVRFVDFPSFLKVTDDFSESAMHPAEYESEKLDDFARAADSLRELDEIKRALGTQSAEPEHPKQSRRLATLSDNDNNAASYQPKSREQLPVPRERLDDSSKNAVPPPRPDAQHVSRGLGL